MSASNYAELKILDHVLGTATFAKPAAVYVGLYTADPGEAGPGTEVAAGLGYARQAVAFSAAAAGQAVNAALVTFPPAAGGAWGTITHFGIFDAVSGGNLLLSGQLMKDGVPTPRVISDSDALLLNAGAIQVNMD